MSLIQQEIFGAMSDLETFEGDGVSAAFLFPKEFAGFKGHFENNPILPGICKIQAVIGMYEKLTGKTFRLIEVTQAKYFLPVTFGQKIIIQCHSKLNSEGQTVIKAIVKKGEEKIALLQLMIQPQS